jgi:PEP-CTERM motif
MKISRVARAVTALLSFAAVSGAASASIITYDWTLSDAPGVTSGGLIPGSGTLTVDTSQTQVRGGFTGDLVTSLTGTLSNGATVGLLAPNTSFGLESNSNFLFPTGNSLVDASFNGNSFNAGIGFSATSGNFLLIGSNAEGGQPAGNNGYTELVGPGGSSIGQGGFSIALAPVPLPASLWMMILGLGGLGTVGLRARKQS